MAEGCRVLVLSESPERRLGRPGRDADRAAGDRGQKYFLNSWTAHGVPKGALIVTDEDGAVKV